jgi:hypothetical protein
METIFVFVAGTALFASAAFANPFATEVLRARTVAGPHVQLTYGMDSGYNPMGAPLAPPSRVTTYGTAKTAWTSNLIYYRTNTGSGLVSVQAIQMCDCHVPPDTNLAYEITVTNVQDGKPIKLMATSSSREPSAPPASTNIEGDSGVPLWEIPDPVEVQGIDCGTACAAATQAAVDAGGGACSISPLGKPAALGGLGLLAALALMRRRRR